MTETILRCKNLTLGYGREIILNRISLDISRGAFVSFTGPNGAGKTTLLRGILGLLKPLSGSIETPFHQNPAGYVPQHKSIDPLFPLTVRGIVKMGFYPKLGWWGRLNVSQKKQLETILDKLKLTEHAHKNYRDLSGGTKQKVLIARALVSGAEIFILDEPTSELDEDTEAEVLQHLQDFVRKENKTVLMVLHGINHPAVRMASHVCIVDHGKITLLASAPERGPK